MFGCTKCKAGFSSFTGVGKICLKDKLFKGKVIPHCLLHSFDLDETVKCYECEENYVLTKDYLKCVPKIDVPFNCSKAIQLSTNKFGCFECSDGFLANSNYECQVENQLCANLIKDDPEKGIYCEYCNQGYKLTSGTCELIDSSDPCNQYNKSEECISCKEPGTIPLHYTTQFGKKLIKCVGYTFTQLPTGIASQEELNLFIRYNFLYNRLELEPSHCPDSFYKVPLTEEDNQDLTVCVNIPSIPACIEYNEAGFCKTCEDYYGPDVNGNCIKELIKGCKVYKTADVCQTCIENHYLVISGNICSPYTVNNCIEFNPNLNICEKCMEGFWKNLDGDCASYTSENCLEKVTDADACLTCENSYYLNPSRKCSKSTIRSHCQQYSQTKDECEECIPGFYLSKLNECVLNPSGIPYCSQYNPDSSCKVCKAHYYVFLGNCVPVSNPVTHCSEYFDNGFCAKCESGYFPNNLIECLKVSETSCKEWIDKNNCKSCNENKILMIENGFRVCKSSPIPNCTKAKYDFITQKIICLECEAGYFINEQSTCARSSVIISNCLLYERDSYCKLCDNNYTLSNTGKICFFNNGPDSEFCLKSKYLSNLKCEMCNYGYYMNHFGDCVKCPLQGCAICDPSKTSICNLCLKGYYMNTQQKCIQLDDGTAPPIDKQIGIFYFSILHLSILFFCFLI
jgi:hypothetical protein